jgi:hypothetical protein
MVANPQLSSPEKNRGALENPTAEHGSDDFFATSH